MSDSGDAWTCVAALKVLIIEDDEETAEALREALNRSGMRTACALSGAAGMRLKNSFVPDVILVDMNLPDTSGVALVRALAQQGDCGIVIVSGQTDDADRIVGLEIGADDYVCKPPQLRELLARIRAVHRRSSLRSDVPLNRAGRPIPSFGTMKVDLGRRMIATAAGENINLTSAEFTAFETLLAAKGETVSRNCLSEAALRRPWQAEDRSVDQLVFGLRKKLGAEGQDLIRSIRCAGYMMSSPARDTRFAHSLALAE